MFVQKDRYGFALTIITTKGLLTITNIRYYFSDKHMANIQWIKLNMQSG